ncbi:HsmA family protein [Ruminiclostridium cellobioparum]|uniref:TIGR03987 family protein n=1 Tax=Ruminiclostridium cellobioparum subsp. termitidis CT1112 TaxID=1195236 RepID=S0FHD2_RUMCE|nr:HsmA family protein [Ruminiclostridium cellobioparum]EMS69266.1 TIGR03987 family protein [Ruminiclostridium cellobioparum subsp. termitidis CT1112]
MLLYAVIAINLALVFYSIGVWSEKLQGTLKKWHLVIFWTGLAFDTLGTSLMSELAQGGFKFNFHGITGLLAIILMLVHAMWATYVLIRNDERAKSSFHKFSIFVWVIWLIPFISGAILGMAG